MITFSNIRLTVVLATAIGLQACQVNDNPEAKPYDTGVLVLNEGNFQKGNASVSFLNRNESTAITDIFRTVNNRFVGDVLQDYAEANGRGYLVVNNSNKIEVVEATTFKSVGAIESGLPQCRRIQIVSADKAYVSCWGDAQTKPGVAVVDLRTLKVTAYIPTGKGPEDLLLAGNRVLVANSGGFEVASTVDVIDVTTDKVTSTIPVGDVPTNLVTDSEGQVWVLCSGKPTWSSPNGMTTAELVRINPATASVTRRLVIDGKAINSNPDELSTNKERTMLYFVAANGVHTVLTSATAVTLDKPVIRRGFYGLGVDPATNNIYGSDPLDYSRQGYVFRYKSTGERIDSVKVDLIPTGFYFK
ncbi:DUF5074 domain-containing protein [Tellurirhabdus rosea]|uniref:DUF5074 domain-containing protein n=1 Tax=Tellurirhabdus rosea TaxID=2674997 RepID=UPI00224FC8D6|nr:DUF5074 domain-containing protein [Tellurirhabdus rosea]